MPHTKLKIPPHPMPDGKPLKRGDVVYALRDICDGEATVYRYQPGVVFEEANAYGDGLGPMVCFPGAGLRRNVYAGDVIEAKAYVQWQAEEIRLREKLYAEDHLRYCKEALKEAEARVARASQL